MIWRLCLLACFVLLFGLPLASAASLDDALRRERIAIIAKLRESQANVVGTLQFGVRIGDQKTAWNVGPINRNMADYLELALVSSDEIKRIKVLRAANREAERTIKNATLETREGRAEFFRREYPVWSQTEKDVGTALADRFLTGRIDVSPDFKQASVHIVTFGSDDLDRLSPLHTFKFRTDLAFLSDCGLGVSLHRQHPRVRKFTKGIVDDVVDILKDDPQDGDTQKKDDPQKKDESPNKDEAQKNDDSQKTDMPSQGAFPVRLRILFDGKEQRLDKDLNVASGKRTETFRISQPHEGQKVSLTMTNVTDHKLGAVLMVGGQSTLNQGTNPEDATRWVLPPDKIEYTVAGFYRTSQDKQEVFPFKVLSDSDSEQLFKEQGDKIGQIALYVFSPVEKDVTPAYDGSRKFRVPSDLTSGDTVSELHQLLRNQTDTGTAKGLVSPRLDVPIETKLNPIPLGDVMMTDTIFINYYSGTK